MIDPYVLLSAYALDWVAGDPRWLPHPVRLMGRAARWGECLTRRLARKPLAEMVAGALVASVIIGLSSVAAHGLIRLARHAHPFLGSVFEAVLAWTTLATRSLVQEAGGVMAALQSGDLPTARSRVAMIVGRDTAGLDESEVSRAVVETVAESSSDGIVAPLFYLTLGGVPLAMAYKAVSTLDSMIGHAEPPYTFFGRFAARADDLANFLPARLTALLLVAAAALHRARPGSAWSILWRDGHKHPSPNAGRPEAAMAGALGVRLGGLNTYGGRVAPKPYLGAEFEPPTPAAARSATRLATTTSLLGLALALAASAWGR